MVFRALNSTLFFAITTNGQTRDNWELNWVDFSDRLQHNMTWYMVIREEGAFPQHFLSFNLAKPSSESVELKRPIIISVIFSMASTTRATAISFRFFFIVANFFSFASAISISNCLGLKELETYDNDLTDDSIWKLTSVPPLSERSQTFCGKPLLCSLTAGCTSSATEKEEF